MTTTHKRYIATRKTDGALLWAETVSVPDQVSDDMLSAMIRCSLRANHSRATRLQDEEISITMWPAPANIQCDVFL